MKHICISLLLALALPSEAAMDEALLCQTLGGLAETSLQGKEEGVSQDDAMVSVYRATDKIEQPFVRGLVNGLMAQAVEDVYQQDRPVSNAWDGHTPPPTLAGVVEQRCQQAGVGKLLSR